jgi:hypothetical protein
MALASSKSTLLILAVALAGCGAKAEPAPEPTDDTTPEPSIDASAPIDAARETGAREASLEAEASDPCSRQAEAS